MSPNRQIASLAVALSLLLTPLCASAQDGPKDWRHSLYIYGIGAAIDGTAQIGPVEVPIDLSISDVFDALEFGAMAAYRVENKSWSFSADATFMALGGSNTTQGGLLKGDLDVDQLTLMGTVGRRLSENTELLFGAAYFDLSTKLRVTNTGDLVPVDVTASRDVDWIDPFVGLRYNRPIGKDWRLNLRGDIGGFGVGSEQMYHLLANLQWQISETFGMVFGYRLIDFDYEDGSNETGGGFQRYDLSEQGPLIGVSFTF